MKIKKMQHLYQLTFLPHLFPINCYLFETNSGLIVIDMGVSSFVSTIQNSPVTAIKKSQCFY